MPSANLRKRYALNGIAGLVQSRKARSTGKPVSIYNAEQAGLDTDGGNWATVCEEHGSICSHETIALAQRFAAAPEEWCEDCQTN